MLLYNSDVASNINIYGSYDVVKDFLNKHVIPPLSTLTGSKSINFESALAFYNDVYLRAFDKVAQSFQKISGFDVQHNILRNQDSFIWKQEYENWKVQYFFLPLFIEKASKMYELNLKTETWLQLLQRIFLYVEDAQEGDVATNEEIIQYLGRVGRDEIKLKPDVLKYKWVKEKVSSFISL